MGPGLRTSLLVILCGICVTTFAQRVDPPCVDSETNCGTFCCGREGSDRNLTACCASELACCPPDSDNEPATCDGDACPGSLGASNYYDDDDGGSPQLRNNCCVYFRSGCCSDRENDSLDLLFKLAIGLSIGVFGLLVIIGLLIACCCCCVCC